MPSQPLSFRKTREHVAATITDVQRQGDILNQHAAILNQHTQSINGMASILTRGFWGRLRWLVRGCA